MTRYIHSSSLKAYLVARVYARWQATVQDGDDAEDFWSVGTCEVFFGYKQCAFLCKNGKAAPGQSLSTPNSNSAAGTAVTDIDGNMLLNVWMEFDTCQVTKGAHIAHL